MSVFYSPTGNREVWGAKPEGYFTPEEWAAANPPPVPDPPTLEEAKAAKTDQINREAEEAILAGFDYKPDGETLHFDCDQTDQINLGDAYNKARAFINGEEGGQNYAIFNGYRMVDGKKTGLVPVEFTAATFIPFYGASVDHKSEILGTATRRKAVVESATTIEEVEAA